VVTTREPSSIWIILRSCEYSIPQKSLFCNSKEITKTVVFAKPIAL
jgi:hypothetical protein